MSKTSTAIVATASIAAAALATPKPAEARCLGCWIGAGIAAGVIGGALASQAYGYCRLRVRIATTITKMPAINAAMQA